MIYVETINTMTAAASRIAHINKQTTYHVREAYTYTRTILGVVLVLALQAATSVLCLQAVPCSQIEM
jgi:hypothetical protein